MLSVKILIIFYSGGFCSACNYLKSFILKKLQFLKCSKNCLLLQAAMLHVHVSVSLFEFYFILTAQ